CHHAKQRLRL
ncbi:carboxylesterase family protein, partial [Vibrio parahaemolyticus VPTS-2010_2]